MVLTPATMSINMHHTLHQVVTRQQIKFHYFIADSSPNNTVNFRIAPLGHLGKNALEIPAAQQTSDLDLQKGQLAVKREYRSISTIVTSSNDQSCLRSIVFRGVVSSPFLMAHNWTYTLYLNRQSPLDVNFVEPEIRLKWGRFIYFTLKIV